MKDRPLRVLVVDDTVVYRKIVSDILKELPDVEVVGVAHNGKAAVSKIASLKPDVLTLDIEMPEMNGLEVLEKIRTESMEVGAIMLSTLTQAGGEMTMKALELGAFDFIPKPESGSMDESRGAVKDAIIPMLKAFSRHQEMRSILRGKEGGRGTVQAIRAAPQTPRIVRRSAMSGGKKTGKSEIVCIGISTGGPNALSEMLPKIPGDLHAPILIVQHMPPIFTQSLAKSLSPKCAIKVKEASDGE
ncbi:MAG: response regulator, partial [Deltaproteobacteria bacterium]|nr:response regulator [Deltaproteobacteria bacterium]